MLVERGQRLYSEQLLHREHGYKAPLSARHNWITPDAIILGLTG